MIELLQAKNEALNILCDVLTRETECSDVLSNSLSIEMSGYGLLEHSVSLTIDINRHKEVLVKATSAIIILLLKHFRLSHIYHFEFLAQVRNDSFFLARFLEELNSNFCFR